MNLRELEPGAVKRRIGDVILEVDKVSLSFGGVKALSEVSFDVREHEVRAIIGPNGAGKSSMLNVINGVYQPQQGHITFRGETREHMNPRHSAERGIARTFQSLALFKGMSVLDNILAGRNLRIRSNIFLQALRVGPALTEEIEHRRRVEEIIDFLEIQHVRKTQVGRLPYGLHKRVDLGRALAAEPRMLPDRARHGRRDGPLRSRCGARLRQEDRRRNARRRTRQPGGRRRLPRGEALMSPILQRNLTIGFFALLVFGALSPMLVGGARFPQWLEVVLGGLMSGVLYSLVALGLVLIFKASGVFNFAQGAMVLFAALSLVRMMEKMPFVVALALTIAIMVALAWVIERLVLRPLVNQEGIVLFMATLGVAYFLDGLGQTV